MCPSYSSLNVSWSLRLWAVSRLSFSMLLTISNLFTIQNPSSTFVSFLFVLPSASRPLLIFTFRFISFFNTFFPHPFPYKPQPMYSLAFLSLSIRSFLLQPFFSFPLEYLTPVPPYFFLA
ncbi:hypothetical protein [Phaffia rhodozyma]|uniref:Uncharacterized protein n=1 Tax=Phaffia rhodozyma TaxID=264483 RepID=A0A0F7SLW8_PHARH|nr:hypothetical protein [Phaffia rhodozyma]